MYEAHFGLMHRPFSETVNPSAYVSLPSHAAILRRLHYAFVHDNGPSILVGPPGCGKTLLARQLASELNVDAVHLTFPALSPADLLVHLAQEFGGVMEPSPSLQLCAPPSTEPVCFDGEEFQNARFSLLTMRHLIGEVATFDALRLLLNFTSNGSPDLSLLVLGCRRSCSTCQRAWTTAWQPVVFSRASTESESSSYVIGTSRHRRRHKPRILSRCPHVAPPRRRR